MIGQQTSEEEQEESPLDDLIRQLQQQQDERLNSAQQPAGEGQTPQNCAIIT